MPPLLYTLLVVLLGAILTVWGGGVVVARTIEPYAEQLKEEDGLVAGGRIIGYAERLLIYVFVLANAPGAIGFLVTAKSIFRFGDVTGDGKRRHAEYIIIGTLTSFAYAVTLSYLVRWILTFIGGEPVGH
mgnify:CR=1 FL=1